MYIKTSELPQIIKDALKLFGYTRLDVTLEAREAIHVGGGAGKGSRNVIVVVDLGENKIVRTLRGSWGGQNMFVETIDDVDSSITIPDNFVVVFGTEGGTHGSFANLYANTKTVAPLLVEHSEELTKGQLNALYVYRAIKSSYRPDELHRLGVRKSDVDFLIVNGFITEKGNGRQITLKGKNAAPRNTIY